MSVYSKHMLAAIAFYAASFTCNSCSECLEVGLEVHVLTHQNFTLADLKSAGRQQYFHMCTGMLRGVTWL